MNTPTQLRERAADLRASGDRSGAREAEAEAMALALQDAQSRVLSVEVETRRMLAAVRTERMAVIADALDAGWSYSRIARALGISHQRVQQLASDSA